MKYIVITGVSRGIGRNLVPLFLNDEANAVIGISRNGDRLDRLSQECNELPGLFHPVEMDISQCDPGRILDIIGKKAIDILINNAAILRKASIESMSNDEIDEMFSVNVRGLLSMTKICLPGLKRAQAGCMLNIGSMGGVQGSQKFPGLSVYSATKGAVSILTECLAEEYKATGIHFNCMALGGVRTEMLKSAFPDYDGGMKVEAMATYIHRFCTEDYVFFNGRTIPVSNSIP